ncbi:helix-turn-helix domain-containing protein [Rossellomorea sp. GCM10028870]|uniref:helix-turn-helix domain-containing protein n=1 Tax=Rossellomorea sp. GCM10028870 TaxID=3273426 RepID=UPI00360C1FCC
MIEGKIISFYREKRQMTQRDLGIGICSSTHVSKIERGLTEYSIEVLNLLANRLQVDLKKEIETYYSIKSMLHDWMNAIIMLVRGLHRITKVFMPKEKPSSLSVVMKWSPMIEGRQPWQREQSFSS